MRKTFIAGLALLLAACGGGGSGDGQKHNGVCGECVRDFNLSDCIESCDGEDDCVREFCPTCKDGLECDTFITSIIGGVFWEACADEDTFECDVPEPCLTCR